MNIQQIGSYVFAAGDIILTFLHGTLMTTIGNFLESVGIGLTSGQGTFSVKVGNAAQVGQDITGLGFLFNFFKFLQPAEPVVLAIGTALAAGTGTFGPIRIGSVSLNGSVASNGDGSDTVTFTVAPWGQQGGQGDAFSIGAAAASAPHN